MADIRIDISGALTDGQEVTFKAPCDCTAIEGFIVYYIENGEKLSRKFTMKDAHGNNLANVGNLFKKDAYIKAVLNTRDNLAYLQNADTNAYLEAKITPVDNLQSTRADLSLSAKQGKMLKDTLEEMKVSFQDGCNAIYDAVKAKGVTPASKSLNDIVTAIGSIQTDVKHSVKVSANLYNYAEYPGVKVVVTDNSTGATLCTLQNYWTTDASGKNTHSKGADTTAINKSFTV